MSHFKTKEVIELKVLSSENSNMFKFIIFGFLIFFSSCSPFGGQTIIESLNDIFQGEASKDVVSGGTNIVETNPGLPAQNYKATVSVGGTFSQPSVQTNGGYTVFTSVK